MKKEKEYLRRNQIHANSVGGYYGIKAIIERVEKMRRKPSGASVVSRCYSIMKVKSAVHGSRVAAGKGEAATKAVNTRKPKQVYFGCAAGVRRNSPPHYQLES